MDEALGPAEQSLFLQLVQHAQVSVRHAAGHAVDEFRLFDEGIECALNAHPGADRIPQGQIGVQALGPHLQQAVKESVGYRQAAVRLCRVVADPRRADLLQVVLGLELVDVPVTHHVVGGIHHRGVFLNVDAESGVVDGLGRAHEGLHHHVHREVLPLVKRAPEIVFVAAALGVRAAQGQLIADVHLIPADLVDHHHGPCRFTCVQLAPQRPLLVLYRQRGDFRHATCQLPHGGHINLAQHCHVLPGLLVVFGRTPRVSGAGDLERTRPVFANSLYQTSSTSCGNSA